MPSIESTSREILLEKKINDELLRLCRGHALNHRHNGWLMLGSMFGGVSPIVGLLYYLIDHGGIDGYPWSRAGLTLVAAIVIAVLGHWFFARRRNMLNAEIRRVCREAIGLGYFIVKRDSRYRHQWYPYLFVLAVSHSFSSDAADDASDQLAELEKYPDPYGLSGLLDGYDPPLPSSASRK